jgi:cytochrome oxidase Cu insertion factor (SCO1/SenC/PrrC family)
VSPAARRGSIVFALGLVLILGLFAFSFWSGPDEGNFVGVPIGGPFTLTDQYGVVRHDSDFRDGLMLVYFGYTFCPDACPTALNTMSAALDKLGDRAKEVRPIFITVDPARDTVAQMKLYATNFTPRLVALTGTDQQIAAAARAYRVFFQKEKSDGEDDYAMDHSAFIYLIGRDGRYLAHFGPDVTADAMAATLKKHL